MLLCLHLWRKTSVTAIKCNTNSIFKTPWTIFHWHDIILCFIFKCHARQLAAILECQRPDVRYAIGNRHTRKTCTASERSRTYVRHTAWYRHASQVATIIECCLPDTRNIRPKVYFNCVINRFPTCKTTRVKCSLIWRTIWKVRLLIWPPDSCRCCRWCRWIIWMSIDPVNYALMRHS